MHVTCDELGLQEEAFMMSPEIQAVHRASGNQIGAARLLSWRTTTRAAVARTRHKIPSAAGRAHHPPRSAAPSRASPPVPPSRQHPHRHHRTARPAAGRAGGSVAGDARRGRHGAWGEQRCGAACGVG